MSNHKPTLSKVAEWLENYWPNLLIWIGGTGLALSGIWTVVEKEKLNFFRSPTGLIFIGSALSTAVGGREVLKEKERAKKLHLEDKGRVKTLQKEVARLEELLGEVEKDYFKTFEIQLEALYKSLNFSGTERISIYRHNGQHFLLLGRYSKNPNYSKRGRAIYFDYEGCIGEAWDKGKACDYNIPDSITNETGYLQRMKSRWGLHENIVQKFTMKSRSFAAYAIDNFQIPLKRTAVIVFESLEPQRINNSNLQGVLTNDNLLVIRQLLETMKPLEPSPIKAEQEGY